MKEGHMRLCDEGRSMRSCDEGRSHEVMWSHEVM